MNEERQRVLRMLKAGRITVEEAEALLEALGEEQEGSSPPGRRGTEAGQGVPGEFQRLIDDIVANIDVEGIVHTVRESVGTVRESLLRSKAEVHRIRDEVRRAARRAREEGRRAAKEARRGSMGISIAEAIEGLWGLADASGAWPYDAPLGAGQRLALNNLWGDARLSSSPDGQVHARATIRAWGRDEAEARANLDQVRIAAGLEDGALVLRVDPQAWGAPRRSRRSRATSRQPASAATWRRT